MKLILQVDYVNPAYKVISNNRMYFCRGNRKILTPEYQLFKEGFTKYVPEPPAWKELLDTLPTKGRRSKLILHWYTDLYYKNGELVRKDSSNIIKPFEDTLSEWLGIDDKYNMVVQANKYVRQYDYDTIIAEYVVIKDINDPDENPEDEIIRLGVRLGTPDSL